MSKKEYRGKQKKIGEEGKERRKEERRGEERSRCRRKSRSWND